VIGLVWDWHGLFTPWNWPGILTHLSIEEVAALVMAGILFYGKYHAKHHGFFHRFAHSLKAQFAVDLVADVIIAITTIQVMHL
jgi:hypothetical protein